MEEVVIEAGDVLATLVIELRAEAEVGVLREDSEATTLEICAANGVDFITAMEISAVAEGGARGGEGFEDELAESGSREEQKDWDVHCLLNQSSPRVR